ncbi:hypothetical protein HPB52_023995 [Rhipicephalus sanguineus]|uniref:Uncharacterized protein n=1 Tax=Rhipicephalus sanguineus TaxID=34632 RepID=A0A9D4T2I9_RHISA|nr:hypothetical protein HPB52_023995 [Rhipicephalus sanguineus]
MEVTVDGEDIHPDLVSEDLGWQQAVSRRSAKRSETAVTDVKGTLGPESCMDVARNGGNRAAQLKGKLLKAGRMPRLPKEEAKVIVIPRGGLNIARMGAPVIASALIRAAGITESEAEGDTICPNWLQNIVVVSTPKRDNATQYVRTKAIKLYDKLYEISAYEAAPHNTCKGVIRGIPIEDSLAEVERRIINSKNPPALEAKRIKDTSTVIVAFEGLGVPSFVKYGPTLHIPAERALPVREALNFRTQRQRDGPGAVPGYPPPRRQTDDHRNMGRPPQFNRPKQAFTGSDFFVFQMR